MSLEADPNLCYFVKILVYASTVSLIAYCWMSWKHISKTAYEGCIYYYDGNCGTEFVEFVRQKCVRKVAIVWVMGTTPRMPKTKDLQNVIKF